MHIILILLSLITKLTAFQLCEVCQNLVKEFHNGLTASEKGNFGGGNTAWEETKLGTYSTSETRLVHILEGVCPSSINNRDKCQYMREELEEQIEKWWFDVYRKDGTSDSLFDYLCVDHMRVCCPANHYGPQCERCLHVSCSERGQCNGNGTREGNGKCLCNMGYSGEICESCEDNFYRANDGDCLQCDVACQSCTDSGASKCAICRSGYELVNDVCVDVNECLNKSRCNELTEYCLNSVGSYQCKPCDSACVRCTDAGASNCVACRNGYQMVAGVCEDINECSADSQVCRDLGQKCTNTVGSYSCDCQDNYRRERDGSCVRKVTLNKQTSSQNTADDDIHNSNPNFSKKPKNKRQAKKIWTKKFEREFFKMVLSIVALGVVSYFLGHYSVIVVLAALSCGYYVFFKSIKLDQIFSRSVYV